MKHCYIVYNLLENPIVKNHMKRYNIKEIISKNSKINLLKGLSEMTFQKDQFWKNH